MATNSGGPRDARRGQSASAPSFHSLGGVWLRQSYLLREVPGTLDEEGLPACGPGGANQTLPLGVYQTGAEKLAFLLVLEI